MIFDDSTKLLCAEREVKMRRKVYPGRVLKGLMLPSEAKHEIAVMEDIANDYREKLEPSLIR
jgi:hypothetical protein